MEATALVLACLVLVAFIVWIQWRERREWREERRELVDRIGQPRYLPAPRERVLPPRPPQEPEITREMATVGSLDDSMPEDSDGDE